MRVETMALQYQMFQFVLAVDVRLHIAQSDVVQIVRAPNGLDQPIVRHLHSLRE